MVTDYTRDEETVVIDLIRRDNQNKALTASQVNFGFPNVNIPAPNYDRNTVLVGTAVPGYGYTGSQVFYYNRVPLPLFIDPRMLGALIFEITTERRLVDLLPAINARFSINLTEDRIQDVSLPVFGSEEYREEPVELKVTPNSMVYLDSLILTVRPPEKDLDVLITQTELNGLTYVPQA